MNKNPYFSQLNEVQKSLKIDEAYDAEIERLKENRERLNLQMKEQAIARNLKKKKSNQER